GLTLFPPGRVAQCRDPFTAGAREHGSLCCSTTGPRPTRRRRTIRLTGRTPFRAQRNDGVSPTIEPRWDFDRRRPRRPPCVPSRAFAAADHLVEIVRRPDPAPARPVRPAILCSAP